LDNGEKVLCGQCRPHVVDIYAKFLRDSADKEMQFGRLWTHCQNCQGSVHSKVICAANDCPIFYKRTKVYKEHLGAQEALAKFNDLSW
jgi:DNA polymerase delta subunit 1